MASVGHTIYAKSQLPSLVDASDCISAWRYANAEVYLGTYNSSAAPYSVSLSNMEITAGGYFGFGFGGLSEGVRGSISVQVLFMCSLLAAIRRNANLLTTVNT